MIIGLSGKIGSGKDTLAMLLQALTMPKGGHWYDNPTEYVDAYHGKPNQLGGWKIKKYGEKLKQIASMLTGIPREKFEDQQFKSTELGSEWSIPKDPTLLGDWPGAELRQITVREFLQKLGNDALRFKLNQAVWTNALFSEFTPECNWIISDMRYPNEAECVKGRGGLVVRITRPNNPYPESTHISETALDHYGFDYEVRNEGTIEDLVIKAGALLILANNQDGTNRGYPS